VSISNRCRSSWDGTPHSSSWYAAISGELPAHSHRVRSGTSVGSHAVRRVLLVLVLLALAVAAGCGGDDEEAAAPPGEGCEEVEAPNARDDDDNQLPARGLDFTKTWALVFDTSCGSFTVTLDEEGAPNTTASLVRLAENGFYDDTIFHRIIPDFVVQGGDPTQSGSGGPGYKTVDAPPEDTTYPKGSVAMAKTMAEAPGTSGSQFFIGTGDGSALTPDYAIVGEVTEGLDVVELIGTLGTAEGAPTRTVLVRSVTVSETPAD
jgi:peptidyl-prolyl cis-trans isomerase B (cyclophilin B)